MKVAEHHFGEARKSSSHRVFKTPWPGDPRINLQEGKMERLRRIKYGNCFKRLIG